MNWDDDDDGPEPCYICGKPRSDYTGCLCDDCRAKWEQQEEAEKAGGWDE